MHLLLRLPPTPRAPLVQPGPLRWVPSRIKHFFCAFSSCRGWFLSPRVFQEGQQEPGPFLHGHRFVPGHAHARTRVYM